MGMNDHRRQKCAGSNSDPLVSVLKFIVPQCFLHLFWNSDWKMGLLHLAKLFRDCLISYTDVWAPGPCVFMIGFLNKHRSIGHVRVTLRHGLSGLMPKRVSQGGQAKWSILYVCFTDFSCSSVCFCLSADCVLVIPVSADISWHAYSSWTYTSQLQAFFGYTVSSAVHQSMSDCMRA